MFFILSGLFIAAFWSPSGKGVDSWLMLMMFNCVFVTFPCGILGQVWYLIVSIQDLCNFFLFSFNGLRKQDPMQSLLSIISPFCLDFNKLNKTGTQTLDSLYHIKLKLLCNKFLLCETTMISHITASMLWTQLHNVTKYVVQWCCISIHAIKSPLPDASFVNIPAHLHRVHDFVLTTFWKK